LQEHWKKKTQKKRFDNVVVCGNVPEYRDRTFKKWPLLEYDNTARWFLEESLFI